MHESFARVRRLVEHGEGLLRMLQQNDVTLILNGHPTELGVEIANWLSEFEKLVDNPAYQVDGDPKAVSDVPRVLSNRLWELESVFANSLEK